MKLRLTAICLVLLSCRTVAPAAAPAAIAAGSIHLTLIGTNDTHGWLMSQVDVVGGAEFRGGGVAAFSSYVKQLRAENPGGVLLLDAGDLFQGTLISNLSEGAVVPSVLDGQS